ncbi:acetylornithine deacetylase/succinyl-diaminopimelate desuccinylase and related deacylases [Halalkalibacter wakoensis JCM 9140]|uniref:Acetylornithine deacetylase/succinyl-diaminopimelate desuccinylase and related deacylases n=1 Tax=Halalkalibacter wakoensis JCM 9140 TaxID=1236970 RepID=W4Q4S3_9BACI|nr:M20 family metallopeptidase [Halalkalibacter wakoensis]GAE26987.1 acetylornithine deacetylase/succinyl-diaminopimelate desuccinylase and related deacylases [Halalkalibacter wakoensis JCM 9140]
MDVHLKEKEMLELLERLVNIDSGSHNKQGVDHVGKVISPYFEQLGFQIERKPQESVGDHLIVRHPSQHHPSILIVAHMDTVFEDGTAVKRPFTIKNGRAYGPGVIDMKASLVSVIYALHYLKQCGLDVYEHVQIIFNSDEEIGSHTSRPIIESEAVGKLYALIMEPARRDGSVVTERRGNGRYTIEVHGKAAHSGIEPEKGRSAIEELAHKIVKLHELNDHERGISVNVGMIEGGDAVNTVSALAIGHLDVRIATLEQAKEMEKKIEQVCASADVSGTDIELTGDMSRPPMLKNEKTEALFQIVKQVGAELGITIKDTKTGGGSDASFTSAMGIATIDGLGPIGGNAHSDKEYLEISSLTERTLLLAKLIERLALEGKKQKNSENQVIQ